MKTIHRSECLNLIWLKLWNLRILRHTTIFFFPMFILISNYFLLNKFNIMKGNVVIIQKILISLNWPLQKSGCSMGYHGNHYFLNIKKWAFLQQEALISLMLLNLSICYIKYVPFEVKCTDFPFYGCGGVLWPLLIKSKIQFNIIEFLLGHFQR